MTVIRDTIELGASDEERYRHLRRIVENILLDVDGGASEDRRRWITWVFLYIMWHESGGARTRTQGGGGPGRGLMQFEPATLHWLIKEYILGPTPGLVANLAAAAGVTPDEMREALRSFRDADAPGRNVWPDPGPDTPAKKLERWLLEIDSFGVKLMRYAFKALGATHAFPPQNEVTARLTPRTLGSSRSTPDIGVVGGSGSSTTPIRSARSASASRSGRGGSMRLHVVRLRRRRSRDRPPYLRHHVVAASS